MNKFPEVAQNFFFLYSRMEYAIKKEKMVNRNASANWDQFAKSLGRSFFESVIAKGKAEYLIANPPRKQVVTENRTIDWIETKVVSDNASLFSAIRIVRNNLFHGGKYPRGHLADSARDERLLHECIAVLSDALDAQERIAEAFRSEN